MEKALLIAEKPSLRRTLEDVYNKHKSEIPYSVTFMDQRGHLLTLKSPDELDEELKDWSWDTLPIHPEEHGGWKYKVIEEKKTGTFLTSKERFYAIRDELKSGGYDFIINAGDPDQEGELLIRIVLSALGTKLPIKRYWSNDTTEAKVLDAFKNLRDDEHDPMLVNLLAAAYGRQHSDYRFGMNLSRAASLKMNSRVACGRVKTPIMSIVCKREKEIENFKPSTCYGVKANYSEGFSGNLYDISTVVEADEDGKDNESAGIVWFDNESDAKAFRDKLTNTARVSDYKAKRVETLAPKLFKLATAQIAAGKLGYNASETLSIIQSLYDKGYMSYPRTDCEYLSSGENLSKMIESASCVPDLAPFISKIDPAVIGKVKSTKKWVNDKALTESGHSALVPTAVKPDFTKLSEDEQKIYTLICRQFIAIFLPPLVQDKTLMMCDISGEYFKSTGKTLVSPGFSEIFGTKFTDMVIPEHSVGDILDVNDFEITSKTTTCPKRFTDASLIEMCESPAKYLEDSKYKALGKNLKIGTPATRASIIEELIKRDKYLQRTKEKKTEYIIPTDAGMRIYENIKDCDICKVDLTGEWEEKLEAVRRGELTLSALEEGMISHVNRLLSDMKDAKMTPLESKKFATVATCPECGMDIISGPKGFYCSGYKEKGCGIGAYKMICDSTITDEEFATMLTGATIKKMLKKGSTTWEQELKYNFAEHKFDFVKAEARSTEYTCPKCGKLLADTGRTLKCDDACGFVFWKTTCGKALTEEQIGKFFNSGSTGLIRGLKGKSGKSFNAEIVLSDDKKGTKFKFEEKK